MKKDVKKIIIILKEIIDKYGENYLINEPYEVYKYLIKSEIADKNIAASILHLLLCVSLKNVVNEGNINNIAVKIQKECNFNKKISNYLAKIIVSLYSKENINEWKNNELSGFNCFINEEFIYEWHGFSIWDGGNVTCDSYFNAKIILKPTSKIREDKTINLGLTKNPFLAKEFFYNYFAKKLKLYLDDDFEEYCNCDDYYPPCAEDYSLNLENDLKSWCKENGFKYISSDGEGQTNEFEPKSKYIKYR